MMRTHVTSLALAFCLAAMATGTTVAQERYEDAVGDAIGDAPDIAAVTVEPAEWGPLLSIGVEFTGDRQFGTDMKTWSDTVFVMMSAEPTVDERGILSGEVYTTGTHGVTVEDQAASGAMLATPPGVTVSGLYWNVVDVEAEDDALIFTFDRQLIGCPSELQVQVLVGVERDDSDAEEGDAFPELSEPPLTIPLGRCDT
jgi:hypothetical protein